MPINLLPETEKKTKKDKNRPPSTIELNLPPKEKKRETFKQGGVLEFFKSIFRQPKKEAVPFAVLAKKEKEEPTPFKIEEKEEKKRQKVVVYTEPKKEEKIKQKKISFWSRLFGRPKEKLMVEKPKEKIILPVVTPQRKEEPLPHREAKPEKREILELLKEEELKPSETRPQPEKIGDLLLAKKAILSHPQEIAPPKPELALPQPKKPGLFSRFMSWLKRLFGRRPAKPKPLAKPSAIPQPEPIKLTSVPQPAIRKEAAAPLIPSVKPVAPARPPSPPPSIPPQPVFQPPPPPVRPKLEKPLPPPPAAPVAYQAEDKQEKPEEITSGINLNIPQENLTEPSGLRLDVNLMPEELKERAAPKDRIFVLIMIIVVAVFLAGMAYLGLYIYESRTLVKIEEVNKEIYGIDQSISTFKRFQLQAEALKQETENIKKLIDQHIYWSRFYSYLEKYTNPDIYYTSVAADSGGKVTLAAVGKDYESVAKQLIVFQKASDFVKSVSITSIKYFEQTAVPQTGTSQTTPAVTNKGVSFSISLSILPDIFYQKL